MGKTMTWMMPIFTLWITATFPSALGVYWIASNVFSIGQTVLLNGYFAKQMKAEIDTHDAEMPTTQKTWKGNKKRKGKN
jgi:YidC/Oxa1 family membrane protein insertase